MHIESREVRDRLDEAVEGLRFVVEATTNELERWHGERDKRKAARRKAKEERVDTRANGAAAAR
jgi:hypothetical protein